MAGVKTRVASIDDELRKLGFTFPVEYDSSWHTVTDELRGKIGYFASEAERGEHKAKHITFVVFKEGSEYTTLFEGPEKNKALDKAIDDASLKAQNLRKELEIKAALEAEVVYSQALPATKLTPYLENKGFTAEILSKVKYHEHPHTIVFPVTDMDGKIWSVAFIFTDGDKAFTDNSRTRGCFYRIGASSPTQKTIYVCEGIATGFTISLATGGEVFCALSAHNLPAVTRSVRQYNPRANIVICADNDAKTKDNPGLKAAFQAKQHTQAVIRYPRFESDEELSDFNDLHKTRGLSEVQKVLEITDSEKNIQFVECLGYDEQTYFFITSQNPQIIPVSEFSKQKLYHLMTKEYWDETYGVPTKDGLRVDPDAISSQLMEQCRKRGIFRPESVRGVGVWQDHLGTVVNLGNSLFYDENEHPLFALATDYQYVVERGGKSVHPNPLSAEEAGVFKEILETMRFSEDSMKVWLGGWLYGALVCGSLKWRPHLLLTGEQGSGKSVVFDQLLHQVLGNAFECHYVKGDTSAAGIRQMMKHNALPLLFDEFEMDGQQGKENKNAAILELCRQASVEDAGVIAKGTSGGKSMSFSAKFMACVGGINSKITNAQDKARFAKVELQKVHGDPEQWRKLQDLLEKLDEDFCKRLFARAVRTLPKLLKEIEVIKYTASKQGFPERVGQQFGTLIASYLNLISDDELTGEMAEKLVTKYIVKNETVQETTNHRDMDACADQILTYSARTQDGEVLIGKWLIGARGFDKDQRLKVNEALSNFGLSLVATRESPDVFLGVASSGYKLHEIYKNTPWQGNWAQSLSRLPGAQKNKTFRIAQKSVRGTLIPLSADIVDQDPLQDTKY